MYVAMQCIKLLNLNYFKFKSNSRKQRQYIPNCVETRNKYCYRTKITAYYNTGFSLRNSTTNVENKLFDVLDLSN